MKKLFILIIIILILGIGLWKFSQNKGEGKYEKKQHSPKMITVSILPQKFFVEQIVQDKFEVSVMIPDGASPATYDPTPKQLQDLSNSTIYFRIGYIPFELSWIEKIKSVNSDMEIVDTSLGVDIIGKTTQNSKQGIDPHIWLSVKAVKIQLKNILDTMVVVDPDNSKFYTENYKELIYDIDALDVKIKNVLKGKENRKFLVYHPAWSYFARDYALIQIPIELEGKEPSAKQLINTIDLAKSENIKIIFVQKQFDIQSANTIANEIGGDVLVLDPLSEDWIKNMGNIAEALKKAFENEVNQSGKTD